MRAATTPGGQVANPTFFDTLYTYAWFVTFALSFVLYLAVSRSRDRRDQQDASCLTSRLIRAGAFSWVELATTDPKAAVAFYRSIFGWNIVEHDMGPNGVYTIFTIRERDVAAAAGQHPQELEMRIPPHWSLYVTVDDADAAAKKVESLGGKVEAQPFDVMNHGRMAVIQDPAGAIFNLWQPKEHIGVKINNEPGALCWSELTTQRSEEGRGVLYRDVWLGHQARRRRHARRVPRVQRCGQPMGGIMETPKEMPAHIPSVTGCHISRSQAWTLASACHRQRRQADDRPGTDSRNRTFRDPDRSPGRDVRRVPARLDQS